MNGLILNLVLACILAPPVKTSEEATTHLYIRTTPPGARISLGGEKLGKSPGVFPVAPGVQRIVIELDGHDAAAQELSIEAGRVTRLEVNLRRGNKLPAAEADIDVEPSFGSVNEQVLHLPKKRMAKLLDLDAGEWASISNFGTDDRDTHRRVRQMGVDISGGVEHGIPALLFFDASIVEIPSSQWDTVTPEEIASNWPLKQNEPLPISTLFDADLTKLPKTCLFETREGTLGVLQLAGFGDDGNGAKIRYKVVSPKGRQWLWPKKVSIFIGPDQFDDGEVTSLDLATGRLLDLPDGGDRQFSHGGEGDLVFVPEASGMLCLRGAKVEVSDAESSVTQPGKKVEDLDIPFLKFRPITFHKLRPIPCRFTVTTAENRRFDVTVQSITKQAAGRNVLVEYDLADRSTKPQAETPEDTNIQAEHETTTLDLKLPGGESKSVTVAMGQSGRQVARMCTPARIYADDDPWLGCMAYQGGHYAIMFQADGPIEKLKGRIDAAWDKLYAVVHYKTDERRDGEFLLPKSWGGKSCGDFVTLKVPLGPDTARVATVAEGMNRSDVMQLFTPAVDHTEPEQMILFDAIHNNGRYLLLFDSGDANDKTLSTVMYWPGGEDKSILLLPRGQHDKAIPAKYKILLEGDRK